MVRAAPASLRERIAAEPDAHTDVIDEVQKAPQLLDLLHALLEERPELRFVLTGSSARNCDMEPPICWEAGWWRPQTPEPPGESARTGCSPLTGATTHHIQALPLERLEALADALLDFQDPADLSTWLTAND